MMEETVNVFFFRLLKLIKKKRRNKLRSQNGLRGLCFDDSVQTVGVLVILVIPYHPVSVCVCVCVCVCGSV